MNTDNTSIVDVAVGIVMRDDGRVLLAERPEGKPKAGYWEFPGGKFESGENPQQALTRELHEELGIELDAACPWITREHRYEHMHVRLHLYRVLRWHGEPHGREDQRISWEHVNAVNVTPLLPANHDILRALALPPVYAITHAAKYGTDDFMDRLRMALERGVRLIQVRERDMSPGDLGRLASRIVSLAHDHGAQVLVNGDANIANTAGADGVHLQAGQLMQCRTRPDIKLLGASCHNREELLQAAELGADLAVLSPVLSTSSHPGEPTLGWEHFAGLCRELPMPVYALGGMRFDMVETAMTHGAHGVSLLSAIWKTPDEV
jgi:8-oxo-dGTP diphosphatase